MTRCLTEGPRIGAGELARRRKTRGERHIEHGKGRLTQQLARPLEPEPTIMAVDTVADMVLEESFELAKRYAGLVRECRAGEGRLDASFHDAQHMKQLLVGHTKPIAQIHALRAKAFADVGV